MTDTTISVNRFNELIRIEEQMKTIRRMCGYVENGTSESFTIFQDDATREWCIKTDNKRYYAISFSGVLDKGVAAMRHYDFLEWVNDTYQGMEREEVLNHFIQSGEYPQQFLDDLANVDGE